jgi:hypothetical protein
MSKSICRQIKSGNGLVVAKNVPNSFRRRTISLPLAAVGIVGIVDVVTKLAQYYYC